MSEATIETTPVAEAAPVATSSVGDPFPLGLISFGISSVLLASVMSGMYDATSLTAVLSLALALGFFTELIAGLLHFARGETFPGLVFTIFAGFWLSYALLVQFYSPAVVKAGGDPTNVTGLYLLAWGVMTAYLVIAALRTNKTTIFILGLLALVFLVSAWGTFAGSTGISHAAGYILFVDAIAALYASAAMIINTVWERPVVPIP
ncbi:MAG TPA: acetate uptake transporter [Flexivirga sp.]|uniref:acetate uptake transporter n=1 Tax=Flexivirga sp. TaxID=1962927 RepID=UPI002C2722F9|nr:acetate uptake transporter [Flexivirga sp.]HWC22993.1 acetate uptake transporter [Flexivirga sp.]